MPHKKLVVLLVIFLLVACSGERYKRAYMAAGDGLQEKELEEVSHFATTDDFNLVIKLNPGGERFSVMARFYDPNGDLLQEIQRDDVDSQTGTVILGIDYEGRDDLPNEWLTGRYKVEIFIDGDQIDTLFFEVQ